MRAKPIKFVRKMSLIKNEWSEIRDFNEYKDNLKKLVIADRKKYIIVLVY